MKKINVGAGYDWFEEGWETLDNAPLNGLKKKKWQHFGKCWETNLQDNHYDILFTSHTLEHVPQFRIEQTFAEFNRILRVGGKIRVLVPNLKLAAQAYLKNNKSFFKYSEKYSDNLGIGGSFMRVMISPGHQTLAVNGDFSEVIGSYAHLYCFDFGIMKNLMEKYGFGNVKESQPGKSSVKEMRKFQSVNCNGKSYSIDDKLIKSREFLKYKFSFVGFDKKLSNQLAVEATKVKNVSFNKMNVFNDFKQNKFDSLHEKFKFFILFKLNNFFDSIFLILKRIKRVTLIKFILRK